MTSTYLDYRFYAADFTKSSARIAAEPSNAHDTAYYQANIGKVKTVDEFLNNFRLYTYALKAYGLEDMVSSRGFMKKVLESDLTDAKSFANRLNDTRYKTFGAAFSFTGKGAVTDTAGAQAALQEADTLGLYSQRSAASGTDGTAETAYYTGAIGKVKTLDDLLGDSRLYNYVMTAYGLDPAQVSKDEVKQVLESDIYDPKSVVNTSGSGVALAQSAADTTAAASRYAVEAGSGAVAQAETAHFLAAMPGLKTLDGLLSDGRVVTYLATAYGIPFVANATASQKVDALRAVITSDLADPQSTANQLGQSARDLAQSLNFGRGSTVQSAHDQGTTTDLYTAAQGTGAAAQAETAYYRTVVPGLKTLDDVLNDPRLVDYLGAAYGVAFDPGASTIQKSAVLRGVLTSDPTDSRSVAGQLGAGAVQLAASFNFTKTRPAQTPQHLDSTLDLYARRAGTDAAAQAETAYYEAALPTVKTADGLLGDQRLVDFVVKAFGITFDVSASAADRAAQLRAALTSDVADPRSAALHLGDPFRQLAAAFTFGPAPTTSASPAKGVIGASDLQGTLDLYAEQAGQDPASQAAADAVGKSFVGAVASVATIDDLVSQASLVDYLIKAYRIPVAVGATVADKAASLRSILTSDPDDPKGTASLIGNNARALAGAFDFHTTYVGDAAVAAGGDPALVKLAADFNFDAAGKVTNQRLAQSIKAAQTTVTLYDRQAGTDAAAKAAAKLESSYYSSAITKVRTLDGLLSDQRLVDYLTKAYGIIQDAKLSAAQKTAQLRAVLTSDVSDPKSVASKLGDPYRSLAAAFTFSTKGEVVRDKAQQAQSVKAAILLKDRFVRQSMEDEAGASNDGVRLALYFQRMAPTVTSAYSILADKALLKVVQTVFGLPASNKADIDSQARAITKKLKLADLKDPKKVDTLVRRFTILYDMNNTAASAPANALLVG